MTTTAQRQAHWQQVWTTKAFDKVSWHQDQPDRSLELIAGLNLRRDAGIIDIGGGQSALAARLLEQGRSNVAVLDIAEAALARAHDALGPAGDDITWICADITQWQPIPALFELWHDRAVFHFLTSPDGQQAYVAALRTALIPGGHAIIATFAPDGPEQCSGLPVCRHDGASLTAILGAGFTLESESAETHLTPGGSTQNFRWCLFRRD